MPNNESKPTDNPSEPTHENLASITWPEIVRDALKRCPASAGRLETLCAIIEQDPRVEGVTDEDIRAKVLEVLETSDRYVWFRPGTWALRSKLSAKGIAKLTALRREFYARQAKR